MEGLLGKIGGGLKGLLNSSNLQGIAGAAAFGANPLLGLLLGPGIKNSRERKELENEGIRNQLLAQKRRSSAQQELQTLLQDRTTVQGQDRTAGLMDVEGGAPSQFTLPGKRQSVPTSQTVGGQQQLLGLLAQTAPDTVATGLLGQMFPKARTNTKLQALNDFQASVGRKATEAEAQNIFGAASPDAALQAQIAGNRALLLNQQLNDARDASERKRLETAAEDATIESAINSSLNTLSEMADINARRAQGGVLAQPGVGSNVKQSIAQGAGLVTGLFDSELSQQFNQIAQDNERFDQAGDQLAITRLETGTFKASSDARFKAWRATKPSSKRSVGTNDLTIADTIEGTLATADSRGVNVPDRAKWEALVKRLRKSDKVEPDVTAPPLPFDPANAELVK